MAGYILQEEGIGYRYSGWGRDVDLICFDAGDLYL